MNEEENQKKAYEERLQHRLSLLKEAIDARKIKILPQTVESLKKVRYAADGQFDLSTVDAIVRSTALAVEVVQDREDLKNAVPLSEIQNTYFTFLEKNFGQFFNIMRDRGLTPHDAGIALSQSKSSIEAITKDLPLFLETIEEFWNNAAPSAYVHVEDMSETLKAVFGGDFFPSHAENIASKCGIYTDTIVLPDPFIRTKPLFTHWPPDRQAYYCIKHGLNLLQYKELAVANVKPPIVVVLPDFQSDEQGYHLKLAQDDLIIHAAKIFGCKYKTCQELMEFAGTLDSIDKLVSAVVDPSRLVFDIEFTGSLRDRLEEAIAHQDAKLISENPGAIVMTQLLGRMAITNELLIKSARLRGTPVIDAPTSWQYFVWKLENDARAVESETHLSGLHILRGLQSIGDNQMEWLGRVPPAALIELRQTGAIVEIRHILTKGVHDLASANLNDFQATTGQVLKNIQDAFDTHKSEIKELRRKKWKFAGSDIGSWIVVGSLAVAASATGHFLLGLASLAAEQLLDAPKLRDIPKSIKQLAAESTKLKQSPVGLLFKYNKEKA